MLGWLYFWSNSLTRRKKLPDQRERVQGGIAMEKSEKRKSPRVCGDFPASDSRLLWVDEEGKWKEGESSDCAEIQAFDQRGLRGEGVPV